MFTLALITDGQRHGGSQRLHFRDATQPGTVTSPGAAGGAPRSWHDALIYDDVEQLTAVAVPWLLQGLAAGDAAVVAVSPELTGPLCEAVGHRSVGCSSSSGTLSTGPGPPRRSLAWRQLAEQHATAGRRIRSVGEPDFGTTPADWLEWQAYESVVNVAFAPLPLWGLCVFSTALPEPVLASVRQTHPQLVTAAGSLPSPDFVDPATYLPTLPVPDEPLEAAPPALADG